MSGTSMATPQVSGVVALVWSVYPNATASQIKARVLNTVDPLPSFANKLVTGGRVNVHNALDNDTVAPAAVDGLVVSNVGLNSVSLQWNGTGDDGHTGQASRYEIRYASASIDDEAAWQVASRAGSSITLNADGTVSGELTGLNFNQSGYVAVRAYDNVGNASDISVSVPFATKTAAVLFEHDTETLNGVTIDRAWGLEAGPNGKAFSDSPGGAYSASANNSLTMDSVAVASDDVVLAINTKYDTEDRYDFCYVEYSTDDGALWKQLDKFAGNKDWHIRSYSMAGKLAGASSFKLRFRLTSDSSIQGAGWLIDQVTVFAPQP